MSHSEELLKEIYTPMRRLHATIIGKLVETRRHGTTASPQLLEDLVDCVYILKKTVEWLEDARKEINAANSLMQRVTCLLWAQKGDGETIRGKFASGTPRTGIALQTPTKNKHTEKYEALMAYFGVPEEFYKGDVDVVRVHYPGLAEMATEILARGGNLPPALKALKEVNTYGVTCRAAKGVDIDAMTGDLF